MLPLPFYKLKSYRKTTRIEQETARQSMSISVGAQDVDANRAQISPAREILGNHIDNPKRLQAQRGGLPHRR